MLRARDLVIGYPGRRVLDGIALDLAPGEVLALLGPNGGGKTTLLKTLLGLLPASAGSIELDGRPIADHRAAERARLLAYVPQASSGGFGFTVHDWVMMGRHAHQGLFAAPSRADHEAVAAALGRMGLEALSEQPCTRLSGGERQLALIARALAQQARLVLLDEPCASLDFANQGRVLREIGRLAADGLGIAFTTHDPNHALRHAHRAMLVGQGRLLASGEPAAVITAEALAQLYGCAVFEQSDGITGQRLYLPG